MSLVEKVTPLRQGAETHDCLLASRLKVSLVKNCPNLPSKITPGWKVSIHSIFLTCFFVAL